MTINFRSVKTRDQNATRSSRILEASSFLLAWLAIGLLWELSVELGLLNGRILPPPSQTLPYIFTGAATVGFGVERTSLAMSVLITLGRVAVGLTAGLVLALLVASAIVQFRILRKALLPIVQTLAPISPVAWIPFAIATVGIGGPAAILVVFMAIFGSMTVSAVAAFEAVPNEYLKVARNLGTSRMRTWTSVFLPAALPAIMTMLRVSFFAAWMAVLAGEMAGLNSGLGYLIIMGQQMYNMRLVMVGIMAIGAIGFLIDRALLALQRSIVWWEYRM
jgi:NitT/TauT family transport system permease protein